MAKWFLNVLPPLTCDYSVKLVRVLQGHFVHSPVKLFTATLLASISSPTYTGWCRKVLQHGSEISDECLGYDWPWLSPWAQHPLDGLHLSNISPHPSKWAHLHYLKSSHHPKYISRIFEGSLFYLAQKAQSSSAVSVHFVANKLMYCTVIFVSVKRTVKVNESLCHMFYIPSILSAV